MSKNQLFDKNFIKKISELSKLQLSDEEDIYFSDQFNNTLKTIGDLNKIDTKNIPEAYNITGLKNVFREDNINTNRVLSQKDALSGSNNTYKGYFVVKGILNEK
jgi:aspartyl/glutamyl-tRNA(Asn/Gln) amidotransferase C subunit